MAPQPSQRVLFEEGSPSSTAFLLKSGKVSVTGAHLPDVEIEGQDLLLGCLELFLGGVEAAPRRLCTLTVSSEDPLTELSFDKVLALAKEYEFGINCNRFLAALLERTNDQLS